MHILYMRAVIVMIIMHGMERRAVHALKKIIFWYLISDLERKKITPKINESKRSDIFLDYLRPNQRLQIRLKWFTVTANDTAMQNY